MIEYAQKDDIAFIAALEKTCIDSAWTADMLYEAYDDDTYKFFVALANDIDKRNLAGYIYIKCILDEAEICNIAIDKSYRQNGYATRLLNEAEKYCIGNNIKSIFLEVSNNNLAACKLYEKCGYTQIAVRKNYYKNGDSALIMSKKL